MDFVREKVGNITVETRRESFIVHPSYGYDGEGNKHSDALGVFETHWRETPHPEFLYDDLDDLIAALVEVRDERA